jgi:RecB family exonuclease
MVGQEDSDQSKVKHIEKRLRTKQADIVDVIERYVRLKRSRSGKYRGRCPFHVSDGKGQQQTLVVWPQSQSFYCFRPGCKANVGFSEMGRRQGVHDFLKLVEEMSVDPLPQPDQETQQEEPSQELAGIAETLVLPMIEPGPVFSVSYSMVESYQLCPLYFRCTYVEQRNVGRMTLNRRLGLSIHITLSKFYGLPVQERTLSRLHQLLDENWQSSPRDIEEDTYWHERAHEMLEALYHSEGTSANPIALESSFTFPVENFRVSGRIDRVDEISTGRYEVIDYKVLRGYPRDEHEAMASLQSVCLYFGAKSLDHLRGAFPAKITYVHVDTGARVSFSPTESAMEQGLFRIKNLVKEIQEATDFPATQNRFCSACQLYGGCPATELKTND